MNPYEIACQECASSGSTPDCGCTKEDTGPSGRSQMTFQTGPMLLLPVTNRSMLLFQLRELHQALTCSKVPSWRSELRAALRAVVPKALTALSLVDSPCGATEEANGQVKSKAAADSVQGLGQGQAAINWLLGFLACAAPDCLVGASLYPGAQVSHKGLGNTLHEEYTVLGYEADGSNDFEVNVGELMYVCPSVIFDRQQQSELTSDSERNSDDSQERQQYGLEMVFSHILKTHLVTLQTLDSNTNLMHALCNVEKSFFGLMKSVLSMDVSETRTLPLYSPTSHDTQAARKNRKIGRVTLAMIVKSRTSTQNSLLKVYTIISITQIFFKKSQCLVQRSCL